jgi:chromosome transmission fidelity protein 1
MSDVVSQLFSHLNHERIRIFSCGHVIPEKNLQALVVTKSPRGSDLEYKADKQGDPNVASYSRTPVCHVYSDDYSE